MRAGVAAPSFASIVLAALFSIGSLGAGVGSAHAQETPEPPAPEARGPVVAKDRPKTPLPDGEVGAQIIDGTTTSTTTYPWMAALLDSAEDDPFQAQFCAGVLIDPQWVLTAGHCAEGETTASLQVALGRTNLSSIQAGDRRTISEIHIHPSFHYQGTENVPADDVALLKLSAPAIGIPTLAYDPVGLSTSGGPVETVVGWGAVDFVIDEFGVPTYYYPDALQHGVMGVTYDGERCGWNPSYRATEFTSVNMMCASALYAESYTGACVGDSGGPMVIGGPGGFRLLGITSWGYPYCAFNSSVFARVKTFASWIDGYLGDPGAVGTFNPVAPVRILDTRIGTGALMSQPLAPGQSVFPQVTGMGGVPVTGVTAVTVNVTVTGPTSGGWLTLYPAGQPLPTASNLNFAAGQTVPNFVTVKLGQGGKIGVDNTGIVTNTLPPGFFTDNPAPGAGTVHVIIDLVGWYKNDTTGAYFHAIDPVRIVDTRSLLQGGPMGPQTRRSFSTFGGTSPIPFNGASSVVLNVTVTDVRYFLPPPAPPGVTGWLTLYPHNAGSLAAPPTASNLNFKLDDTIANLVTVRVVDNQVAMANTYGNSTPIAISVVVDLVGYYGPAGDASGDGGQFHAMTPSRLVDTRALYSGGTANPSLNTAIGPQATIAPTVRNVVGIPVTATAVALNGTATGPTRQGWFTLFPGWETNPPTASNLNFLAGQTVPNAAIVKVGNDSKIGISNSYLNTLAGTTHAVLDAVGWFEP